MQSKITDLLSLVDITVHEEITNSVSGRRQKKAIPLFVMKFIFGFGISFLLPVLLMLLERAGLVTLEQLRGARRYAIVGMFAIAAVLTPPDIVSQLLLAIPLCMLFELALIAIWFTRRRRKKAASVEEAAT